MNVLYMIKIAHGDTVCCIYYFWGINPLFYKVVPGKKVVRTGP